MGKPNWENQTIWTGDCLDVMRGMNSESVDLIYLDPPFNSNANYAAPIGSQAAGAAFRDTWGLDDISLAWHGEIKADYAGLYALLTASRQIHSDSMMSYLIYMAIRIMEMRRLLKASGSIYLHCDSTASHYLKVLMDAIFGMKNFRNDITWRRTSAHNDATYFGRVTDNILYYGASPGAAFHNRQYQPHSKKNLKKYRHNDKDGRGWYRRGDLTGPKSTDGESGQPWRGYDPTTLGRHWSAPKTGVYAEWIEQNLIPDYRSIESVHGRLEALQQANMVAWTENGLPELKRYLAASAGTPITCHWEDIPPVNSQSKELTKYPTQKPLELLKRIIAASSNSQDVVLDPFCGCATACIAAQQEGRQWVGIDISEKAAAILLDRLKWNKEDTGQREDSLFTSQCIHRTDIPKRTDLGTLIPYNAMPNRKYLYGEQGGYCNGCETHFEMRHLQVDHIIARAKGGTDHISNLQLLCGSCNSMKGTKTHEELLVALTDKGYIKRKMAA